MDSTPTPTTPTEPTPSSISPTDLTPQAQPHLIPTEDNLILEDDNESDVTASGIHLPQLRSRTTSRTARVLAVGPGKLFPDFTYSEMTVRPGDRIAYDRATGTALPYHGRTYVIIPERQVLAIIERTIDP